ncbi:P-loop containing nucleoside triphosphate hydrolases superfamily protein [Actinidia rufa]|uniref:P-loop containing nucleoside triphosphate hydrolases superfamily protein n=1 Tax=Actinidia rufa TaxID=165716 RepID=A0A7J0FGJ4_9ERIC|nr:P-loop containing nucleoside triphosphate hydrolases superfamily protein [Actinidia rufa]
MAKKGITRRELLDRWRGIEDDDDDDDDHDHNVTASDPPNRHRLRQLKEEWFSDAFNYLVYLPKDNHIWCSSWDLMGPLLETFYNYFKDERLDSPLKLLWKRISEEMRRCTQCICQHHQAQEMYGSQYELSSIGPLLDVLQSLDEERVTQHLKEMNSRLLRGEYDPVHDNPDVISVMFECQFPVFGGGPWAHDTDNQKALIRCSGLHSRSDFMVKDVRGVGQHEGQGGSVTYHNLLHEVLMFPILLDDQSLVAEFQIFIEAIDNSHELTLAGHQQYPGIYALLFLKRRRARSIGLRLAGNMGKLRLGKSSGME